MNAEIVAIGTELLLGQNQDTNSAWLARELARIGIDLYGFQAVGDNEKRLEAVLKGACERSPFVLTTGGLGPTVDDVTRKVAAKLAGRTLVFDEGLAKAIEERFARFRPDKPFPKVNLNQAFLPQGATVIPNPNGTAPGFLVKVGKGHLACLPGVPSEMKPMFEQTLVPFLKALAPGGTLIKSRVYRTTGMDESALNERIRDLFETFTNPTLGVLANAKGVDIRLTVKAASDAEAEKLLDGLGKTLTQRLPNHIYGLDEDDLETIVGRLLTTRHLTLALAESCTGGLIAHRVTEVPGSTQYFLGGWTVYSNRLKSASLGVDPKVLESKGAVSPETAREMAKKAREKTGADLALAVTGIAGPSGGSPEKPVGLVYLALADDQGVRVFERRFSGDRSTVKMKTSQSALEFLRRACLKLPLEDP